MVHAYWLVGREIFEEEQRGAERAGYGEELTKTVASHLTARFGKGFSHSNVKRMRQFYLAFPDGSALAEVAGMNGAAARHHSGQAEGIGSTVSSQSRSARKGSTVSSQLVLDGGRQPSLFPAALSWSHYCVLMRVEQATARGFYEIEAHRESWSVRELERQIGSMLFERVSASKNKDEVLALGKRGQQVSVPADVIKDPVVLEFLDLKESRDYLERDLEQAIIDRLQDFLLELGKGFCFVARQKRITLDGDHFYIDLVFYNRLLRAFVLIDLKLGKLTHQDLGQIQMYTNYYDRFQREEGENPTVGIVLCSDKNEAMVKITLPENNEQIFTPRYQLYLPSEDELRQELVAKREEVELERRLSAGVKGA
jgi:predicted nuclease of restriction endonuclease-like (RecB) superfamily